MESDDSSRAARNGPFSRPPLGPIWIRSIRVMMSTTLSPSTARTPELPANSNRYASSS